MIVQKRKGISTFIATLLLMVLAVSAGVVIYAYTMGYLGGFGGPQTMGAISVDTSSLDTTTLADSDNNQPAVTIYLRNIGKTSFTCDSVYVNGIGVAKSGAMSSGVDAIHGWSIDTQNLGEGDVAKLVIDQDPEKVNTSTNIEGQLSRIYVLPASDTNGHYGFVASTTYDIKIIGADNTQLTFQIKK